MTKTKIAKHVADQIVVAVCSAAAKKVLSTVAPEFCEDHETITNIVSGTTGYILSGKLERPTHASVDFVATKIKARKSKKTATTTD